jgi:pre-peptidase
MAPSVHASRSLADRMSRGRAAGDRSPCALHRTRAGLAGSALLLAATCVFALHPQSALAAPANDNFANATAISGLPARATGSNVDATIEPGEPDHAHTNSGETSVWYRWTAPAGGKVRIDTCGSDFDTLLAVYTGAGVAALTEVASNDDACGDEEQSRVTFTAVAGRVYHIAVDGLAGDAGDIVLVLRKVPPPPKPRPGRYSGRTEFPDSRRISLVLSRTRRRVRQLKVRFTLDCQRRGFPIAELHNRSTFRPIRVRRDRRGVWRFRRRGTIRFRGGGRLTIGVRGRFRPPNRVTGILTARASFPGGIRCRYFPLRTVRWSARHR